jgi:NitT/TauT family transport system permease protein
VKTTKGKYAVKALIVVFWLVVWQIVSTCVGNPLILASPVDALIALITSLPTLAFWGPVANSFLHITVGGIIAFALAIILALCAHAYRMVGEFIAPILSFFKSVPVVCIIVLLLIWLGAALVSSIVIIMVVLPTVYYAVREALDNVDNRMAQMLRVFRVRRARKLLFFFWPSVLPYIQAVSKVAVGMSWKSGIAAELIGIPLGTIGEQIYSTKITLATANLFAWMFVVIAISVLCEQLVLYLIRHSSAWSRKLALRGRAAEKNNTFSDADIYASNISISYDKTIAESDNSNSVGKDGTNANARITPIAEFSYAFKQGGIYCLFAPSGSGKTSLLNVMADLLKPTTGAMHISFNANRDSRTDGLVGACAPMDRRVDVYTNVYTCKYTDIHKSIVFQEPCLFEDATALENCLLVSDDAELIRTLLSKLVSSYIADTRINELSGGMKRRVELARALVAPSDILLLDEPFSGLDDVARRNACKVLLEYKGGRTVVLSTHNKEDIKALNATVVTL